MNTVITNDTIRRANEAMIAKAGRRDRQFQTYSKDTLSISVFYAGELYTEESL